MNSAIMALVAPHLGEPVVVSIVVAALIVVAIWDGVWKTIALWKSARHGQMAWFVCLVIFNTAGILPIIYILFFQKRQTPPPVAV